MVKWLSIYCHTSAATGHLPLKEIQKCALLTCCSAGREVCPHGKIASMRLWTILAQTSFNLAEILKTKKSAFLNYYLHSCSFLEHRSKPRIDTGTSRSLCQLTREKMTMKFISSTAGRLENLGCGWYVVHCSCRTHKPNVQYCTFHFCVCILRKMVSVTVNMRTLLLCTWKYCLLYPNWDISAMNNFFLHAQHTTQ